MVFDKNTESKRNIAVSKTELNKSVKYLIIEKHTFTNNSQIQEIQKPNNLDFIRFIDCEFNSIDFKLLNIVANDFINSTFNNCKTGNKFQDNNSFDDCLWGDF